MSRQAPPFPWLPQIDNGPISPVLDPSGEIVLLIPEDHPIEAQGTGKVVSSMTRLLANIRSVTPDQAYGEMVRISAFDVLIGAFTAAGVAAGFVGALS